MKERCYHHHAKLWWCTAPVCKYFMCVRVHVFVSFLRVSKLAKPNPTRASTSLLHEAFSKKNLEKFTVVIASWLDCRQLGFTITQKQNDMKNFLVFCWTAKEAGLWNAVSVHIKEHLPLSRTTVAERIERNTNETTLHSPQKKHKCTRQLRFQNILQLVEWLASQRAVLHVLHWIFMLMMCLKSSKRRFTCQHNIMTHYWRGLSNKSSKISSRTITQGTQRDLKQEKENIPLQMDAISKFFIKIKKKKKKKKKEKKTHNSHELSFLAFHRYRHIRKLSHSAECDCRRQHWFSWLITIQRGSGFFHPSCSQNRMSWSVCWPNNTSHSRQIRKKLNKCHSSPCATVVWYEE